MYKKVLILLFFIPFQLLFAQTSMLKDFPEVSDLFKLLKKQCG
jgi:hypothetical protein